MEISTDLNPLKHRQQATWASGDRDRYARFGAVPVDIARTDGTASRANAATAMSAPPPSRVPVRPINALTGPTINGPRGLRAYDPAAS